jgi:glycosyltransferase involved in cell wall biosynthesis
MRIGIDYTAAVHQGGGIGRYTRSLVRALVALDSGHQFKLLVAGAARRDSDSGPWPSNASLRTIPISDRWMNVLWQRLRVPLPVQLVTGPIELFHSPDFVLPPTGRTPSILTVHDLSFLRVPEFFVEGFREYLEGAVVRAVKKAAHILADSESTRRDLEALLDVNPERVTVIYPGVDEGFEPVLAPEDLQRVRKRYALPARFLMGLSTLQPRKNFEGLIEAFGRLLELETDSDLTAELELVVVGGEGWMFESIREKVASRGLSERVHFLGRVTDADLPAIYTLAEAFVFPSWYEGFGIPVIEAMACGTPVVASDNSSLPEAAGEAGMLVGAGDTGALVQALMQVLANSDLRAQMIESGFNQAKNFSWNESALRLLGVYERFA